MLATPTDNPGVPPTGGQWVHEVKWDGIRALGGRVEGQLRLWNRNEIDVTVTYPELVAGQGSAQSPPGLPDDTLVDGEIVILDAAGRPSFQALSHRFHVRDPRRAAQLAAASPARFMVFDLLRLAGRDLTHEPWSVRRAALEELQLPDRWELTPVYEQGVDLALATQEAGLEGVMSKRRDSPYRPGVRSAEWIKVPHRTEIVAVIGGWIEETESRGNLGALWVGYPDDEATFAETGVLYPLGRVGSGLSHAERDALLGILREIERPDSPFVSLPQAVDAARTHWVEPMLCVQVRYLGRTDNGTLRQPVLRRLRPDVTPLDASHAEAR